MSYTSDRLLIHSDKIEAPGQYWFRVPGFELKLEAVLQPTDKEEEWAAVVPFLFNHFSFTDLKTGNEVLLSAKNAENVFLKGVLRSRETIPVTVNPGMQLEEKWYQDSTISVMFDCKLLYTKEEMDWIRVGEYPVDMNDRIIMITDQESISFYSSWSGTGLFKAFYRLLSEEHAPEVAGTSYEVYRIIARTRAERKTDRLLDDFITYIKAHFDSLEYVKRQQEQVKKQK